MEPIHYLRAFRRRWWVIVLAVLVAGCAAFVTTADSASLGTTAAASSADSEFTATTILWNPGAPVVGQGTTITSLATLAQLVRLPDVATIASKKLHPEGDPSQLSRHVSALADPVTGFLSITGRAKDPKEAEAISTAFSQALITYLGELKVTQIDQRQRLVQEQIKALRKQNADPPVIALLRAALAQLEIDRTAPISITTIQRASAEPIPTQSGGFQAPKSRTVRVLLASLFGLLAGIALALVLERFDTRIRSTGSAEEAFGLPVLAEIPAIRRRRRGNVVTAANPLSRVAGAFRLLQVGIARWTSLPTHAGDATADAHEGSNGHAATRSAGAMTILVTSPEARDGKTTVAANLAVAYAQAGSRVLVVSCDLRRPAIHSAFDVSLEPGLTDAFRAMNGSGSAASLDLSPYLEPCAVVRLAVLPSGVIPEHPAELLGSAKMKWLIERLKKITDVVILDCAPLVVASDVVPLVPAADEVLLVVRAGKTRQEVAASAALLLQRMGAVKAGVVMNDAREFSIPLAKRRMYRPTRKMRKAAERSPQPKIDDPWVPGPSAPEETIDDPRVQEPAPEETIDEPRVQEPEVVEEPSTHIHVPEAEPGHASEPSTDEPQVDPATRTQARSLLGKLHQELHDMRAQLEGFQLELPADGMADFD